MTIPEATIPEAQTIRAALNRLAWPLRLTRAGMLAERLARSFWPFWVVLLIAAAFLAFGLQETVSVEAAWFALMLTGAALAWSLIAGIRRFRWPTRHQALARLDETLPGRPIAALRDIQAIGSQDPASVAVWQAHLIRMAERTRLARPVEPDLRLSSRDRFGLRYIALTVFVMALMFGSLWRVAEVAQIATGRAGTDLAAGPAWEGWIQPPSYTGKPSLYLNDIAEGPLTVPQGSKVTLRLYGEVGALTVAETISGRKGDLAAGEVDSASAPAQDFAATQSGRLTVAGAGGRHWDVSVTADQAPRIALSGEITREADGRMVQAFSASDDFGVVKGRAEINLDLAAFDRRFGLAVQPEPRERLVLDLPMPISGDRASFIESLVEDLSQHPFANLPVTLTLFAEDANGQTGQSEPAHLTLPGRRFFDPLAAGVIEMRRDLLWSKANARRADQILRALTHRPEGFIRNERAYLLLRVAMKRLQNSTPLSAEVRDEVAEALWQVALLVEEGDLADAKARLDRAQDQLSQAIKNGANNQEIAKLMQELDEAMQNYMQKLAQQQAQDPDQQNADNQQGMQITQDQMQAMLDELQKLMQEGRTAEAQELLDQLRKMMENMQVTQGPGGQGSPGQRSMQGLQDTLRDQQGLSDDAFNDLQEQVNPGQQQGQQPGQQPGQQGQGDQPGQQGDGQAQGQQGQGGDQQGQQPGQNGSNGISGQNGAGGDLKGTLADRQQALRDQLRRQQQGLPGAGTPEGEAARDALRRAERAMEGAEEALRGNDIPGAIGRQADAMEALRDGMRNLGEALAQDQQQQGGQQGQRLGDAAPLGQTDPLGRDLGGQGRAGTPDNMLQGEDVYRRAREILDELRRRSSEQTRPQGELDYLRRLLDVF